MDVLHTDIAIIGAGFSGSLLSLLLQRIGLKSILIDRGVHPRFAIGESSTPVANQLLGELASRYDLPRISPMCRYGSWKRTYPEIVCGPKRGFSYFHHLLDQPFQAQPDHANELLVASSVGVEDADTHWLRSDFDRFLAEEAVRAAIPYFDQTVIDEVQSAGDGWRLQAERCGKRLQFQSKLLVDASGEAQFLAKRLGIESHPEGLVTRSRSLFSHFTGVATWGELYRASGGDPNRHPYPCDDSALHHVFDGGWMWVLPFDNGVTSAGFSLDPDRFPLDPGVSPDQEWAGMLRRLPSVAEQFSEAVPVVPWKQTSRIQRRLGQAAGRNWVMLPSTAAFLDPFFSTGNAWTLVGIDRLLTMLESDWKRPSWDAAVELYNETIQLEAELLDGIVSGCFQGFRDFSRMTAMSMFYFAAATWSESEFRSGRRSRGAAFLGADHAGLRASLADAVRMVGDRAISNADFNTAVRALIAPFNRVGLGDPAKQNLYEFIP